MWSLCFFVFYILFSFENGVRVGSWRAHSQDAAVNPFYEVIYSFWSVRLKPEHAIEIFVVDSGDEESDFSAFMTVESDPYGMASPGKNSKVGSVKQANIDQLNMLNFLLGWLQRSVCRGWAAL